MHEGMRKHLCLRLEITFLDEVEPGLAYVPLLHA